jgi:hypothetical protein
MRKFLLGFLFGSFLGLCNFSSAEEAEEEALPQTTASEPDSASVKVKKDKKDKKAKKGKSGKSKKGGKKKKKK